MSVHVFESIKDIKDSRNVKSAPQMWKLPSERGVYQGIADAKGYNPDQLAYASVECVRLFPACTPSGCGDLVKKEGQKSNQWVHQNVEIQMRTGKT